MMRGSHDTAAALANARLIAATVKSLLEFESGQSRNDKCCAPLIAEFAQSLRGERREMYSAWVSLNLAIGRRLKHGPVKQAAMTYSETALKKMMSEGRFVQGRRVSFQDHGADASIRL